MCLPEMLSYCNSNVCYVRSTEQRCKKCYYETDTWPSDISAIFFKYMAEEPRKGKHSACVVWLCACAHNINITVRCTCFNCIGSNNSTVTVSCTNIFN